MSQRDIIHDPVCGMDLTNSPEILFVNHNGTKIGLCGEGCKTRFIADPEKFSGTPLIDMHNIWKTFKNGDTTTEVLRGLSLHIWEGDFVAIIGASGSGKSTLLNMVGLLDKPTTGSILLRGEDVTTKHDDLRAALRSATFGFVFQQFNLIPWLTAYDNIMLPKQFSTKLDSLDDTELQKHIDNAGLRTRVEHYPSELSGGEQQRVALLRALANNPIIILGDEPTGNLDSTTGNQILSMLIDLNRKQKRTLVIVTHDADIAEQADEVITIKDGLMVQDHRVHRQRYVEYSHA